MLSLNEREVLSGMQYYRMDLPISNHISSPLSYYGSELARFGCIGYHARSKGITGEHIFLHMPSRKDNCWLVYVRFVGTLSRGH